MKALWRIFQGVLIYWIIFAFPTECDAACDWPPEYDDLQRRCTCGTGGNLRLTVQCTSVEISRLVSGLKKNEPLDLLALVNGTLSHLEDGSFLELDVRAIQLSALGIVNVSDMAFQGMEQTLNSLNLENNELRAVPTLPLKRLVTLKELDLSRNRITEIPDGAFIGLSLSTLKLADNQLHISDAAFRGLESTLHNLNLKGTGQVKLPVAVKQLSELSFLDLSQNKFSQLLPDEFQNLQQLTALTLERNMVSSVDPRAFAGLNGSLSSLSLLNNKIEHYPTDAIKSLTQLRVLDIGFNRMNSIPEDAFTGNILLTLLAMDGNPIKTLSEDIFVHLNSTLRALSVGGSTLVCDCRLRWILEWIEKLNLEVSSRERNPSYCGRPASMRRRSLPRLSIQELQCEEEVIITSTTTMRTTVRTPRTTVTSSGRDLRAPRTSTIDTLRLVEATRRGSEVTVRWEGTKEHNLVRPPLFAMYRVFGEPHFHVGASVSPSTGWAQLVAPEGRPVIVCVVDSSQAATLSPDSVPSNQCQEVDAAVTNSQLNTVIIGSSAAVCAMIIIAVAVFVCCSRRTRKPAIAAQRPVLKSEHEWETSSLYSGRSIPRARAYHGSVNPSYLHDPRTADDVQSFRSLPPARLSQRHGSQIALSQLSGHHSFLGAYDHWDGDYPERHAPSRLSYAKDNFG